MAVSKKKLGSFNSRIFIKKFTIKLALLGFWELTDDKDKVMVLEEYTVQRGTQTCK